MTTEKTKVFTREIVDMTLVLRTKDEVKSKPVYTFIGGIEIKLKDGREYCFDFINTLGKDFSKKKKHCIAEFYQKWLDMDYVKESNEEMDIHEMTDIQFLKDNAVSISIFFEAEAKDEELYPSKFEVVSCSFRAMDEAEDIDFSDITTLQD